MWLKPARVIELVLVISAIAVVGGQVAGQPLLLSYVETGSMEPTLAAGDGFVVLPPALVGPPVEGDIVVYRAEQLDGGGLTTHRIVAETDRGYITQGDANPFTDQSSGEPPVRPPQIEAIAIQLGGSPIVIPGIGLIADAVQSAVKDRYRHLVAGGAIAMLAVLVMSFSSTGRRDRVPVTQHTPGGGDSSRPGVGRQGAIIIIGVAIIVAATASMLTPLGPTEYRIVSAEADLPGPGVIPAGERETATYRVPGGGIVPTRYYLEPASEGVRVENEAGIVQPNGSVNATVTLLAPPETGSYRRYVVEHRYPLVLPVSVVDTLYRVHPLGPVVAVDVCLLAVTLLTASLVGSGHRVDRSPGAATGLDRLLGGRRR